MVAVRHHAIDSQKSRKLETKWLGRYVHPGFSCYKGANENIGLDHAFHINSHELKS